MRNRNLVTEEERKRILQMHLDATKKQYLKESSDNTFKQKSRRISEAGPFQDYSNDSESCINFETGKGLEIVKNVDKEIKSLNINDEIAASKKLINNSELKKPELEEVKNKLDSVLSKEIPNMSADDLKSMIVKLKGMKNNPPKNNQPKGVNEQIETGAIMTTLSAVPGWGWGLIITWLILRLLRCYVYKLQSKLFKCAFDWAKSPLRYITNILLLDFDNLTSGRRIYGCR